MRPVPGITNALASPPARTRTPPQRIGSPIRASPRRAACARARVRVCVYASAHPARFARRTGGSAGAAGGGAWSALFISARAAAAFPVRCAWRAAAAGAGSCRGARSCLQRLQVPPPPPRGTRRARVGRSRSRSCRPLVCLLANFLNQPPPRTPKRTHYRRPLEHFLSTENPLLIRTKRAVVE